MKVTVTIELRFDMLPDGSVWTLSNFHESFWNRYLEVFDSVEIVARANLVSEVPPNSKRVDRAPDITFYPLPFYIGPIQYLKKLSVLKEKLANVESSGDAIILRVGSPIADILQPMLRNKNHPYAVEVVGDPYDTFAPGSIKTLFRPFYRWLFCKKLKTQTLYASAISYVTSIRLPERYPPQKNAKVIYASSIELLQKQISSGPKRYQNLKELKLISVGALEDWRKGPDTAINAIKKLTSKGIQVKLTWVGDGKNRSNIENMVKDEGLSDLITFKGHLPQGDAIFQQLDEADIFILPTRGEGLPRAMIEAMARGLVCIGSDVGGIPELIGKDFMHSSEDYERLASILENCFQNQEVMNIESEKNWKKSHSYLSPVLQERRRSMYQALKEITHEWKSRTGR